MGSGGVGRKINRDEWEGGWLIDDEDTEFDINIFEQNHHHRNHPHITLPHFAIPHPTSLHPPIFQQQLDNNFIFNT